MPELGGKPAGFIEIIVGDVYANDDESTVLEILGMRMTGGDMKVRVSIDGRVQDAWYPYDVVVNYIKSSDLKYVRHNFGDKEKN